MQQKRIDTTNVEKLVAEFSYCSYLIWDIWKYMYIFLHELTWTNMYAYVCMYMCVRVRANSIIKYIKKSENSAYHRYFWEFLQ